MQSLSYKQKQILDFIKSEIREKGYPPSVREICDAVGLKSTSTVHGHLERMERNGVIRRDPSKPRAIEILDDEYGHKQSIVDVPIIGKVTAGQPILAFENIEGTFPLPEEFVSDKKVFILKVRGESMIKAGILDGDYVIVNQQSIANDGDIVVALIGDEATVKRFYKESDRIRLQPENPYMEPIYVKDVSILGKVAGLLRKM